MLGFEGTITATPSLDICRSQLEVRIHGDWKRVLREARGFHWIAAYGSYRQEIGYALAKIGIEWIDASEPAKPGGARSG